MQKENTSLSKHCHDRRPHLLVHDVHRLRDDAAEHDVNGRQHRNTLELNSFSDSSLPCKKLQKEAGSRRKTNSIAQNLGPSQIRTIAFIGGALISTLV